MHTCHDLRVVPWPAQLLSVFSPYESFELDKWSCGCCKKQFMCSSYLTIMAIVPASSCSLLGSLAIPSVQSPQGHVSTMAFAWWHRVSKQDRAKRARVLCLECGILAWPVCLGRGACWLAVRSIAAAARKHEQHRRVYQCAGSSGKGQEGGTGPISQVTSARYGHLALNRTLPCSFHIP